MNGLFVGLHSSTYYDATARQSCPFRSANLPPSAPCMNLVAPGRGPAHTTQPAHQCAPDPATARLLHLLAPIAIMSNEVFPTEAGEPVITDELNPLARMELPIADEHAAAMKTLLPMEVWLH
jgi:hypothetical protein